MNLSRKSLQIFKMSKTPTRVTNVLMAKKSERFIGRNVNYLKRIQRYFCISTKIISQD